MSQITEFFDNLLGTESWPPRWRCGEWSEFHGWLYIYSDIIIWLAYFIIPVIIIWFLQKIPNGKITPIFILFGAFILLCGATHLLDAIIFWVPVYRLSALLRAITAIVSMLTVFSMLKELNNFAAYLSKGEQEITVLKESVARKDEVIDQLNKKIKELEA